MDKPILRQSPKVNGFRSMNCNDFYRILEMNALHYLGKLVYLIIHAKNILKKGKKKILW